MTIRPIDYKNYLLETQEVTKVQMNRNQKNSIQLHNQLVQNRNRIDKEKTKVTDTNKSEQSKIIRDNDKNKKGFSREKENKDKDNLSRNNNSDNDKYQNKNIGKNIDIKI